MLVIEHTGARGKVVEQNATRLAQELGAGETMMYVEDDIFTAGDIVTVGEEDIRIDTAGATCTVTRGMNSTTDADHPAGGNARLASGRELLSHSFDGATYLSALRCGGEAEAMFALEVAGTVSYVCASTPYQLEVFLPMNRYQPAGGTEVRLLVWSWQTEAVFWAEMQQ